MRAHIDRHTQFYYDAYWGTTAAGRARRVKLIQISLYKIKKRHRTAEMIQKLQY